MRNIKKQEHNIRNAYNYIIHNYSTTQLYNIQLKHSTISTHNITQVQKTQQELQQNYTRHNYNTITLLFNSTQLQHHATI